MPRIAQSRVVITGAASGIGLALAQAFASKGAQLLLADIQATALEQAAHGIRATGATCHTMVMDAGSEADIEQLAAESERVLGGADILINNAGVGLVSSVARLQSADAQWLMNINFWGVVHGCRYFLPQLRQRPEAMIVNISSIFAMVSMPTQSMYNAAKAGVRAFSDSLREELRDTRIQVLCVHPGGIRTNIANAARITHLENLDRTPEDFRRNFAETAQTTPEAAAMAIVRAIEKNQSRLLIGADAKFLDAWFRMAPASASRGFSRLIAWGQAAKTRRRNAH